MKWRFVVVFALVLSLLIMSACGGAAPADDTAPAADGTPADSAATGSTTLSGSQKLTLTSPVFEEGQSMPVKYTCDGEDISPALSWNWGRPAPLIGDFAVTLTDRITSTNIFTHWVIFNIPAGDNELPEGISALAELADGSVQGMNDFGDIGYGGPCPPAGESHEYRMTIYALIQPLPASAGESRERFINAIQGKTFFKDTVTVTYER